MTFPSSIVCKVCSVNGSFARPNILIRHDDVIGQHATKLHTSYYTLITQQLWKLRQTTQPKAHLHVLCGVTIFLISFVIISISQISDLPEAL